MFEDDRFLFDSFIIERLHQRVLRAADNIKDPREYEVSVMSRVVNEQIRCLQKHPLKPGLRGRAVPFPGLPSILIADHLNIAGLNISVADYVFQGDSMGYVQACCIDGDEFYIVSDVMQKLVDLSPHSSRWSTRPTSREIWRATALTECLAWQNVGHGEVVVIRV